MSGWEDPASDPVKDIQEFLAKAMRSAFNYTYPAECDLASCYYPAVYEMDIDGDERWIRLCALHGPSHRRSTNVRIRTLRVDR